MRTAAALARNVQVYAVRVLHIEGRIQFIVQRTVAAILAYALNYKGAIRVYVRQCDPPD